MKKLLIIVAVGLVGLGFYLTFPSSSEKKSKSLTEEAKPKDSTPPTHEEVEKVIIPNSKTVTLADETDKGKPETKEEYWTKRINQLVSGEARQEQFSDSMDSVFADKGYPLSLADCLKVLWKGQDQEKESKIWQSCMDEHDIPKDERMDVSRAFSIALDSMKTLVNKHDWLECAQNYFSSGASECVKKEQIKFSKVIYENFPDDELLDPSQITLTISRLRQRRLEILNSCPDTNMAYIENAPPIACNLIGR